MNAFMRIAEPPPGQLVGRQSDAESETREFVRNAPGAAQHGDRDGRERNGCDERKMERSEQRHSAIV
jgi:hypothetical protein